MSASFVNMNRLDVEEARMRHVSCLQQAIEDLHS